MPTDEQVILVDERDRELGAGEKLSAHREGVLHRAFSVFIFDGAGRLLLQKRAREVPFGRALVEHGLRPPAPGRADRGRRAPQAP